MPPPHRGHGVFHRALANEVRRNILLSIAKKEKYLSEIASELDMKPQTIDFHLSMLEELGLVKTDTRGGKKFYQLKDPHILEFLQNHKPVPSRFHRPPHEMLAEMLEDIKERLDRIEKKLDKF
jgi:DNA-binding transcriptional ArsR family regulator